MDTFLDDNVHFLDIKIDGNKTYVYRKETHAGQYVHFSSFEPWYQKTAWIKCLLERAEKICSNKKLFENQLSKIKSFMSWNGFPKYVGRSIIKKTLQKKKGAVLQIKVNLMKYQKSGLEFRTSAQLGKNLPNVVFQS